jgi:REP element-mobilizing transposase RayT
MLRPPSRNDVSMKNPLPKRKSIRLPDYDYSQQGVYSTTICAEERKILFGTIRHGQLTLSRIGKIAMSCWEAIPSHFTNVELLNYVIMPNHVHGIIVIGENKDSGAAHTGLGTCRAPTGEKIIGPARGSLGAIIRSFKSAVTKTVNAKRPQNPVKVWQRGYYERVVRNDEELRALIEYMITNPANWDRDPERGPSGAMI